MHIDQSVLRTQFWENYPLNQLSHTEWEALCDGCGACCLIKFENEETGTIEYTDVACQLLDCTTGHCSDYANRKRFVPDCIALTPQNLTQMPWLPATCAYKRLYLGKPLPNWHHLITQDPALSRQLMAQQGISAAGRCVSEYNVSEMEQEERVIYWVEQ